MNDKTILIIEDDKSIHNFLKLALKANNYNTVESFTGLSGISLFMSHNPDLILLDLGLPDIGGMDVLLQIRQTSAVPVVIVSARGQEQEKVAALDAGADDYVTKPFGLNELLARIRAALRKQKPNVVTHEFVLDTMRIDFDKRKVYIKEKELHLTPIEYKILLLLTENAGKVLTHKFIQEKIWGYESNDDYQSLRVYMATIRKKIESDTACPRFIMTEIGVGYRFADE
ncbi:MAG: response regulator transcription factor [Oscillospiraceae bacterium]|nr:response regulator transcription factor [Oscillospiraceae bacterium]